MMTEEQIKTLAAELSDEEVGKLILECWQYRLRQESKTTSSLPSSFVAKDPLPVENICQLLELFYLAYKDIAIDADAENPRSVEITLKLENTWDVLSINNETVKGKMQLAEEGAPVECIYFDAPENVALVPDVIVPAEDEKHGLPKREYWDEEMLLNHRVKWTFEVTDPDKNQEVALHGLTEEQTQRFWLVQDALLSELGDAMSKEDKKLPRDIKSKGLFIKGEKARTNFVSSIGQLASQRKCRGCALPLPAKHTGDFCRSNSKKPNCAQIRRTFLSDLIKDYKKDLTEKKRHKNLKYQSRIFRHAFDRIKINTP